jgi:acyl carrier protein
MTHEDIVLAIKDIIHTIAPDEDLSTLAPDVRLREQIELDSMDFLDIVMELRKRYGVQVPEEDCKGARATLDGCVAYWSQAPGQEAGIGVSVRRRSLRAPLVLRRAPRRGR